MKWDEGPARPTMATFPFPLHRNMAEVMRDERVAAAVAEQVKRDCDIPFKPDSFA